MVVRGVTGDWVAWKVASVATEVLEATPAEAAIQEAMAVASPAAMAVLTAMLVGLEAARAACQAEAER